LLTVREEKREKERKYEKIKFFNNKKGGEAHIRKEWDSNDETPPTMKISSPSSSTNLPFSPRSITCASWPRRAKIRYIQNPLQSILPQVMSPI
jgi:hypothetical protein